MFYLGHARGGYDFNPFNLFKAAKSLLTLTSSKKLSKKGFPVIKALMPVYIHQKQDIFDGIDDLRVGRTCGGAYYTINSIKIRCVYLGRIAPVIPLRFENTIISGEHTSEHTLYPAFRATSCDRLSNCQEKKSVFPLWSPKGVNTPLHFWDKNCVELVQGGD